MTRTDRVSVFREIYNTLNSDLPSYSGKDQTETYTVTSAFPEVNPVFPCIVINPITKNVKILGLKQSSNNLLIKAQITIEFYAKTKDGKNALDSAVDYVENLIETTNFTTFYLQREPFEDSGIDVLETGGQKLNTSTLTVNITIK